MMRPCRAIVATTSLAQHEQRRRERDREEGVGDGGLWCLRERATPSGCDGLPTRPGEIRKPETKTLVEVLPLRPSLIMAAAGTNRIPNAGRPAMSTATSNPAGTTNGRSRLTPTDNETHSRTGNGPPAAVSHPAGDRCQRRLDGGRAEEGSADDDGARTEAGEPERSEHVDNPERQPGKEGEPHAAGKARIFQREQRAVKRLRLVAARHVHQQAGDDQAGSSDCGPGKGRSGSRTAGKRPDDGPEEGAADSCGERNAECRARRSTGAADASQARPPAQVHAPPTPWTRRARSSSTAELAKPKARLARASSA